MSWLRGSPRYCRRSRCCTEPEDLRPYECDGLSAHCQVPLAVALPENEQQVREVLRICHAAAYP